MTKWNEVAVIFTWYVASTSDYAKCFLFFFFLNKTHVVYVNNLCPG